MLAIQIAQLSHCQNNFDPVQNVIITQYSNQVQVKGLLLSLLGIQTFCRQSTYLQTTLFQASKFKARKFYDVQAHSSICGDENRRSCLELHNFELHAFWFFVVNIGCFLLFVVANNWSALPYLWQNTKYRQKWMSSGKE